MARVRLLGRARGGRCVFCHDALQGEVRHCPGCEAAWHPECGLELRRCPTIGCAGPAPDGERRRGARRERLADAPPALARHAPPGPLARVGPYVRLVASALVNVVGLALSAVLLASVLAIPFVLATTGRQGALPVGVLASLLLAAIGLGGYVGVSAAGGWLADLPGVWREVGRLLDETTPTAMRLRVFTRGSGKHRTYHIGLQSHDRSPLHEQVIDIEGVLPPMWLTWQADTSVLVYGMPPPGPYVIEFPDGWLALLHPD